MPLIFASFPHHVICVEYLLICNFKVYNLGTDEMTGIPYYYSVAVVKIRDNSSELIYLKVSCFFLYPSEESKIILSLISDLPQGCTFFYIYLKNSKSYYLPEEEQLSHRLGSGSRLDYSHVSIFLFHLRARCSCCLITITMPLPGTG